MLSEGRKMSESYNGEFEGSSTVRYDGEYTRALWDDIANVTEGRSKGLGHFRPHLLMLADRGGWRMSLSRLLSGEPHSLWKAVFPRVEGVERVGNLDCSKVHVGLSTSESLEETDSRTFWVCPERNYLPLKMIGVEVGIDIPLEEARVEDLREIEPGVWFPHRAVFEVYDNIAAAKGERVLDNTQTWTISHVDLNPDYPDSFFSELEIPDGTTVARIRDGEVYEQFVKGASDDAAASAPFAWRWLIMANIAVVVGLVVFWFFFKRSRQTE